MCCSKICSFGTIFSELVQNILNWYNNFNCWRAIARQHTILYNRAKSAKFVGCKIGDMRSRFRFWYPGFLWSETVRVRDSCEVRIFWVHVKIWSPFPSLPLRSFKLRQGQQIIEVRVLVIRDCSCYPGLLWSAHLLSARENLKPFSFVAAAVIQALSRTANWGEF